MFLAEPKHAHTMLYFIAADLISELRKIINIFILLLMQLNRSSLLHLFPLIKINYNSEKHCIASRGEKLRVSCCEEDSVVRNHEEEAIFKYRGVKKLVDN